MQLSSGASARQIKHDVANLIKPPRRIKVSEAVEKNMMVVDGGGKISAYRNDVTPYITRPMDCLSSRNYDAVIFVGPARTGKTNGLIDGWIAYTITSDPADMLVIQISEEKAREYSKKRIDRMLRNSPQLADLMSPHGHDNNVHDKIFKAGNYLGIKWPTVNVLSSSDYRFVALTDYDRLPENLNGEGDPFSLASKRTQTFMSSGMTLVETSPGWEITDPVWTRGANNTHQAPPTKGALSLYNLGTRERWYWQCLDCACWYQPILENFSLEVARPVCPHCGTVVNGAAEKRELNRNGRWVPEGASINSEGELIGEPRKSRIASFWMEGPAAAFQSWDSLAEKLQQAEQVYKDTGSQEKLKTVTNTDWGRPYLYRMSNRVRTGDAFSERAEHLGERVVPEGVRCLFAAVDVQAGRKSRFVCQVIGYGESGERWVIDRFSLRRSDYRTNSEGEPEKCDPAAYPEDWDMLTDYLVRKTYPLADDTGRDMPIMLTAIDSGGADGVTDNAYQYYRRLRRVGLHAKVMLVKGGSTKTAPKIRESWPDSTGRKDRHSSSKGDIPLYILNTNLLKDSISTALDRPDAGANYVHFPDWLGVWFFDELAAEQRTEKGEWIKRGSMPNEAFDLFCYCEAAATKKGYYKIDWRNPLAWARDWDQNSEVQHDGIRQAVSQGAPRRGRRQARFS